MVNPPGRAVDERQIAALPHVFPTVVHMLAEAVRAAADREAVVCGADRVTYAEYLASVAALAHELLALGAAGERVALVMGNSIDVCVAMFATHAARAQVVPLNPIYTTRELAPMIVDAAPLAIIYDSAVAATIEPLARSQGVAQLIRVGPDARRLIGTVAPRDHAGKTLPEPLPDPDGLATLQYTGGTTGRSKGVNLSHRTVSTNISQREALVPTRRGVERILCVMPLFHAYASAMCLHNAVYCQGTLVIVPRYQAELVFDLLDREHITALAGSPTVFTGLLASPRFAAMTFPDLHVSYSGSAPLPESLLAQWEQATGAPVIEGYGQTESGPVISFNPLHGLRKPRSVGVAVPGTEVQIVDAATGRTVLGPGRIGEIRVRGPQLMSGYRGLPQETADALRDGWLYTGDLGELDEAGYLYIRDRKSDMCLVSGYNVYPREVEEVLYLHPAIVEAAVIGVGDAYRGSSIRAYLAVSDPSVTQAELDRHCRANLAAYKVPREYVILPSLPKTLIGKIDKKALR
jgi:long-chain acyl-CoA synthetase